MHRIGGLFKKKKKKLLHDIWQEITEYHFKMYVFSDIMLCCLANSYCCFRGSKLLPNISNYSMIEMAPHPTRNVSSSTQMSESQILKYHMLVKCLEITSINIGTINEILDTKYSFHCHTYYASDLNEIYIVYSMCQSNNIDRSMGKTQSFK